jgi:proton glutamate symport protein
MLKHLSTRVLLALVAGLAAGMAVGAYGGAALAAASANIEAVGGLWLNALRMTIVPLVFSLLVTGIASVADVAATGRLAVRALGLMCLLLLLAAGYATLASQGVLALWPVDAQGAAALRAGVDGAQQSAMVVPGFADWVRSLAPANALRAAVDDAILPLVVFGIFFGFAVTRLADDLRLPLLNFFRAMAETMIVIVGWVLWAAPLGVFALTLGVGLRAGAGAAGALLQYVAVVCLVTIGIFLLPYLLVALRRGAGGGTTLAAFTRAVTPVQVLAFSTQSSLACLPAMIDRARNDLGVPARVTGLVLPLAVAVFRLTSPVANLAVAYFCAHIYGIDPGLPQMIGAVFVAFAISIGTVGLPGQVSFFASVAPLCLTLGVPLDLLPILLAVEVIPDIFRTIGNVTADIGITAVLADES